MIEISIKTNSGEELNIKIDGKEVYTCSSSPKELSPEFVTQVLSFDKSNHQWEEEEVPEYVPPPPTQKKKSTAKSVMAKKSKSNKKGRSK